MKAIRLLLAVGLLLLVQPGLSRCLTSDAKAFEAFVASHKPDKIIFFASWCSGCVDHIKTASANSVFVATFDDKDTASSALSSLTGNTDKRRCFFDGKGEISKAYGVTDLPFAKTLP